MMKKRMVNVRGKVSTPPKKEVDPNSPRQMFKGNNPDVIKVRSDTYAGNLQDMLGAVMREAAARGWGDDWRFIAPGCGGIHYYGVQNPIKPTRKKKAA